MPATTLAVEVVIYEECAALPESLEATTSTPGLHSNEHIASRDSGAGRGRRIRSSVAARACQPPLIAALIASTVPTSFAALTRSCRGISTNAARRSVSRAKQ